MCICIYNKTQRIVIQRLHLPAGHGAGHVHRCVRLCGAGYDTGAHRAEHLLAADPRLRHLPGSLFVQCGIIRTHTNVKDLVYAEEETLTAPAPQRSGGSGKMKMSKTLSISTEINLLGKTVDEALSLLDKYLDDAYLAHLPSVRVVHGKGTGALRNAVHGHLKRLKYVKEYRLGEYGEGDSGVTIVTFK